MSRAKRVPSINGSYRDDGITDQAVSAVLQTLEQAGVEVDSVTALFKRFMERLIVYAYWP